MTQPANRRMLSEQMADDKIAAAIAKIPSTGPASTTTAGSVILASNADVLAGTDTAKATTPAGVKALWSSGSAITLVTDWNNATATGFYQSAAGTTNAPGTTGVYQGIVTVGPLYIIQQVTAGNNDWAYKRTYTFSTSTWSAWIQEPTKAFTPSLVNNAVPISQGGTGATTAPAALTGLGAAAAAHTHTGADIKGGTGDNQVLTWSLASGAAVWASFSGGGGGPATPATTAAAGVVMLATDTDATTGTDTAKVMTPANTAAAISARTFSTDVLTAGTLPLARGGTGGTDAGSARTSLGLGALATLGAVSLSSGSTTVSGTLPIANGGTGATTQQAAINALAGGTTNALFLRGNGTNVVLSAISASDVPTLNQNTTGSAATLTTGRTVQTNLGTTTAATFNGSANITPGITGTLGLANGGTGATSAAAALTSLGAAAAVDVTTLTNAFPWQTNAYSRRISGQTALSALKTPGWYYLTAAEFATMTDLPAGATTSSAHWLLNSGYDSGGTAVYQMLCRNTSGATPDLFVRTVQAAAVSSWMQITPPVADVASTAMTYATGYSATGSTPGALKWMCNDGIVTVTGGAAGTFTSGTYVTVTTTGTGVIASGYRVSTTSYFTCAATGGRTGIMQCNTDGTISLAFNSWASTGNGLTSTPTAPGWIGGTISYPVGL